mmetsp:Transcript_17251/g.19848  ORF Transcript_17251/g.19848 Transcript_17251/m.19848 type:complete len:154 (-) Transcript_17251:168-629(-)
MSEIPKDDNHDEYHSTDPKGLPSKNVLGFHIDSRKVCIFTNTIYGLLSLFGLIMMIVDPDFFYDYSPDNIFFTVGSWISIAVPIINFVIALVGIFGAIHYKSCMVLMVFLWFMFQMISSVILGLWSGVSMSFVFGFPNANLYCQIKTMQAQSK